MKIKEEYRRYIMWAAIGVLYIICFKLVLNSGYMYDDMWSYPDKGMALLEDTTIGALVLKSIKRYATGVGRILIFSFYSNFLLCYLPRFVYKLVIVTAMFLDGIVLGGIIKDLTGSEKLTYLTAVIFPACVSLRASYFNGVYGFHGLVQFCLLTVLLAVYFYIRYRKTEKVRYQVFSCIFWFISLGLYEVSYALCVCFIAALICIDGWEYVRKHFWKSVKTGLPQIIIMIMWCVANVVARHFADHVYDGTAPSLNPASVIITFLKQCTGSFGFGAALVDLRQNGIRETLSFIKTSVGFFEIISYVLLFVCILYVLLKIKDAEKISLKGMAVFGALLIVFPSILIGISMKYQEEVGWFVGYIPQYFGSWGVALILAVIIIAIGRKYVADRRAFLVVNIIAAVIITGTFAFDSIMGKASVYDINNFYQSDTDAVRDSIAAGLFDDIDDEYVLDTSYALYTLDPECTTRCYATWLNRKCNVVGWDDIYEDKGESTQLNQTYDIMKKRGFKATNHSINQYVLLADCNDLQLDMTEDGYQYKLFTSGMEMFVYNGNPTVFQCTDITGDTVVIDLTQADIVKSGKKGNIYRFVFDRDIDINSVEF